jgi:dUTP pyrophosphatase
MNVNILVQQSADMHGVSVAGFKPNMHTKVIVQCMSCHEIWVREFGLLHVDHQCVKPLCSVKLPEMPRMEFVRKHPDAIMPHRSRMSDAGLDVHSLMDVDINPGDAVDVDTGLILTAPLGYYLTVEGRSSMYRSGVVPFRGILDSGYSGHLVVTLMNVGTKPYHINKKDRVAQIIPHQLISMDIIEVDAISPEYNIRGTAGFGSSGR